MDEIAKLNKKATETVYQGRWNFFRSGVYEDLFPHAEFKDTKTRGFYASGIPHPHANGILEKQQYQNLTDHDIAEGVDFFQSKHLPFIWWSGAKLLERRGFQFGGVFKGMLLDVAGSPNLSVADVPIETADSKHDLKAFFTHIGEAFAVDPVITGLLLKTGSKAMNDGAQLHLIAKKEDEVVGGITLSLSPEGSGLWNFAVAPEYRGQGIGLALAQMAIAEAKTRGIPHLMTILMPEGPAWSLFQKLGFHSACDFPFYVYDI